jgi:Uma2 family endonuclease
MATAVDTEMLAAAPALPAQKSLRRPQSFKRDLRPEERTNLTIEEAEALADGRSFELIDGRIIFKMPDRKHSDIQNVLHGEFYLYFKQNPIGKAMPEFSLRFWPDKKRELRTPDIGVFLNENLRGLEKYATRAPDLAIEIVSDDDKASAVFAKARLYLEKGGRMVWVIFPFEKRVVVVTSNEWRWESNTLACPEILPGFSIQVAEIFSGLERKSSPTKRARINTKSRSRRK